VFAYPRHTHTHAHTHTHSVRLSPFLFRLLQTARTSILPAPYTQSPVPCTSTFQLPLISPGNIWVTCMTVRFPPLFFSAHSSTYAHTACTIDLLLPGSIWVSCMTVRFSPLSFSVPSSMYLCSHILHCNCKVCFSHYTCSVWTAGSSHSHPFSFPAL